MKRWKMVGFLILLIMFCAFLNDLALAGLSEKQINAFRSMKSVRIVVDQAYGKAKGVSLPFKDVAERLLLKYAGVKVGGANSKDFDATLKIEAKGKAEGASYSPFGLGEGTFYYTGASLSGTISLEVPGIPIYKKTFNGHVAPPFKINLFGASSTPSEAPFHEVFSEAGSFISALLGIIGEVYSSNPFLIALKDEDSDVRANAAWVLGETKDSRAVEPLILALKDGDADVRKKAAEGLGKIKDSRAVKPLIDILKDNNSEVREKALEALAKIGKPAVEPLILALKVEDSDVRLNAAYVLKRLNWKSKSEEEQIVYLIAILKEYDSDESIKALAKIGKPAVEPLISALKDGDTVVRANAAGALGKIKDPHAIKPLIEALKDLNMDSNFVFKAVSALSEIGRPAVEPLIEVLKDKDSLGRFRGNVAWALRAITGQDFGEDPVKWQEWREKNKAK